MGIWGKERCRARSSSCSPARCRARSSSSSAQEQHPDVAPPQHVVVPAAAVARRRWGLLAVHHHQCLGVALLGEERNRSVEMVSGER